MFQLLRHKNTISDIDDCVRNHEDSFNTSKSVTTQMEEVVLNGGGDYPNDEVYTTSDTRAFIALRLQRPR